MIAQGPMLAYPCNTSNPHVNPRSLVENDVNGDFAMMTNEATLNYDFGKDLCRLETVQFALDIWSFSFPEIHIFQPNPMV